jgi:hypothetical protein
MANSTTTKVRRAVQMVIAWLPWLLSMYAFYWLDSSGTWSSETPHRGKLSVVLLASGMALSFVAHSWFSKRDQ